MLSLTMLNGSIHPQGWVPIETKTRRGRKESKFPWVAFTPKGGCPLKRVDFLGLTCDIQHAGSIHPQGWVPIETPNLGEIFYGDGVRPSSIHPQGWVPIETNERLVAICKDGHGQ